jgi:hypothetical protein
MQLPGCEYTRSHMTAQVFFKNIYAQRPLAIAICLTDYSSALAN